jgi:hypothetical protein
MKFSGCLLSPDLVSFFPYPMYAEKRTLNILSSGCSEKPEFLPKHFGNPGLQRRNGGFWIVFSTNARPKCDEMGGGVSYRNLC